MSNIGTKSDLINSLIKDYEDNMQSKLIREVTVGDLSFQKCQEDNDRWRLYYIYRDSLRGGGVAMRKLLCQCRIEDTISAINTALPHLHKEILKTIEERAIAIETAITDLNKLISSIK